MFIRRFGVLAAMLLALANGCKTRSGEQTEVKGLGFAPVAMFSNIAMDLVHYVQEKAGRAIKDPVEDAAHAKIDEIFHSLCAFACDVVTGAEDEEVREVTAKQSELNLKADADFKWNLALEIQAIVNQAKKIVPGASLAPSEVTDLRRRLSLVEAKITLTTNNPKDPVTARRAVANYGTYLLYVAVGNWVDDLAVDVEKASGARPEQIGQYRQAQLDFLTSQQSRLASFGVAADTVLVTDALTQGSETRPGTIQLGVEQQVRYVHWGELDGQRRYGSPSTIICATNYDPYCAKKATDEAKANFMAEVMPGFSQTYRALALGSKYQEFSAELTKIISPIAADLGKLKGSGVVILPAKDIETFNDSQTPSDLTRDSRDASDPVAGDGGGAVSDPAKDGKPTGKR